MDTTELNKVDTEIEDLTISEDTANELKGGELEAGGGRVSISSFNFMKKTDKA